MKAVIYGFIGFFLVSLAAYLVLSEAAIYYEMWSTGAESRLELADDYGLGLIGIFVVLPISLIIGTCFAWFIVKKM